MRNSEFYRYLSKLAKGATSQSLFRTGFLFVLIGLSCAMPLASAQDMSSSVRGSYVLGVGDVIRVTVHGEEDLALETRLDESGVISYPFLGEMRAVGFTVAQMEKQITGGLKPDYLIDPEVQVSVIAYRNFYVNGEVRRPGGYAFTPGLTVQKAAALAGGFTERASRRKIYVLRENDSEQKRKQVTLESPINPGDTLIIEEGLF